MSSSSKLAIRSSTPELLWHGGGNENGKPDPVFAVDISPNDVLATAGIDASVPPKGSVRVCCAWIVKLIAIVMQLRMIIFDNQLFIYMIFSDLVVLYSYGK